MFLFLLVLRPLIPSGVADPISLAS
jgi:hypothetical protein